MKTYRKNAAVVGILFIIGTVTGLITAMIATPILEAPDYLTQIASNQGIILASSFLYFWMAISCAGIGLALYPIIKQYREDLAIGIAGFRIIEGTIQIAGSICFVGLLALSQASAQGGNLDVSYFQVIGGTIKAVSNWLGNVPMLLSWCIAALMYYFVFYRYKLVPRWLSGWGLVGISLTLLGVVLVMFNLVPNFGTIQTAINMPILFQELVFAIWLITKGVRSETIIPQLDLPKKILHQGGIHEGNRI